MDKNQVNRQISKIIIIIIIIIIISKIIIIIIIIIIIYNKLREKHRWATASGQEGWKGVCHMGSQGGGLLQAEEAGCAKFLR